MQEHFGLPGDAIDVKMATLSKGLASSGGVVAGRREIIDFLKHNARGYVFSGALPAAELAAALAALDVLVAEPERVERLRRNTSRYVAGLRALGIPILGKGETPIVPIPCRDEAQALEMTHQCREDGLFVVPVFYPAVPKNMPRLRTCLMASHTDEDVDFAVQVIGRAARRTGLNG